MAAETAKSSSLRDAFGNVFAFFILILIGVLAFTIRIFSVIKYESVIHEFDPYFNYRVTQFLTKKGIYEFWNWFDDRTWYPLGRVIGGTVYPGLTLTAGTIWWALNSLNIPLSVETVCVFTAPIFSANAAWATYLLTKVPSYISRSVAGSYDNEAVAIFALIFTFYLYVKTLNTGSLFYATLNAIAYFYMVCSWGGYTFIINLIPMHVLLCIVTGRYSSRLYIAYAPFVILGTLLAALVPVVGFNAVMTSEHFGSFLRDGQYRIDSQATPTMLNSLMYKLCYYRFVETDGKGYDRVRNTEIGKKHFKLNYFDEVFTSHHWMVRLYKLKPPKNRIRGKKLKSKSKSSSKRSGGTTKKNPWH